MGIEHVWTIGNGGFFGEIKLATPRDEFRALQRQAPLLEVEYLFVHPLRRGLGWGQELMSAAIGWCDRRGIDIALYVSPYGARNAAGRRIRKPDTAELKRAYRRAGFRSARHPTYENVMVRRALAQ